MGSFFFDTRHKSTTPLTSFDPAATMVYTDIQTLRGVDAPTDYGSGIEYAQGLAEAFPTSGLQIGLWLNGTSGCRDVVRHGLWKDNIHKLFANIAKWNLPKVFLRVGYGRYRNFAHMVQDRLEFLDTHSL